MFKLFDLKTIEELISQCLIKISTLLDYEVVKLFSYNSEKNCIILKNEYNQDNIKYESLFSNSDYLYKKLANSFFSLVLIKKNIINYYSESNFEQGNYLPYIKNIKSEIYIPLLFTDNCITGCLYLGSFSNNGVKTKEELINDDVKNEILKLNSMYQMLYRSSIEMREFLNIIQILTEIVRNKEPFMVTHPYNVAQWAIAIAKQINMEKDKLLDLYFASVLHDVGKLYISEEILNKSSPLSETEYSIIKRHSIYSYNIINSLPKFGKHLSHIAKIVRHHHERYDGDGYPDELKKEDIPLESRIIAVADAVDAMLSVYSYKKSRSLDFTIKELLNNKGSQFDPRITDAMIEILLKTKEIQENILDSPIIWSTLIINTDNKIYDVEGVISKEEKWYIFKTNTFDFNEIDKSSVKKISLYVKGKKNIIEYDVKLDFLDSANNRVFISTLTVKPSINTFEMLWSLRGILQLDSRNQIEISIYKIGGNCLSFTIDNSLYEIKNDKSPLLLKIIFEDNTSEIIAGEIIGRFKVVNTTYYQLKYVNVPDFVKDIIFRQLFKKQIEVRKLANKKNDN